MTSARDPSPINTDHIDLIFRKSSGRAVAALIRILGDIDVAEDALQDAFTIALKNWPQAGLPANPFAWIVRTGRNRAIDRLRRESLGRALLSDVVRDQQLEEEAALPNFDVLDDDQLRLIFTCCHPALSPESQVGLTLRLLCGLATTDVARAFLVEEATMAQRLVRAKRKIKTAHIPYRVPASEELPARIPPVLSVVYLVYNAGAGHAPGAARDKDELCAEGIRLARLLRGAMPGAMEITGLLSLLLLNESRRRARFSAHGDLVLLRDQDRSQWSRSLITEGQTLLRECLQQDDPGPYQIQAAIQAVHADAPTISQTDWPQIVSLYDELLHMTRSPVVAMNRAIAVAEVDGPQAALGLVDDLESDLKGYYLFHSSRAEFLRQMGNAGDSEEAWQKAAQLAPTEAERKLLMDRAQAAGRHMN